MRIGVDMDGVLHSWIGAVIELLRERWGIDLQFDGDPPHWDFIPDNIPEVAWKWLWSTPEAIDRMFDGNLYEGSAEALAILREKKHHVAIVTHRPPEARWATLRWIDKHKLEFDSIEFVSDSRKAYWCPEVDVWLDDSSAVVQNAIVLGKPAMIWDRGYNRPGTHKVIHEEEGVLRVASWGEVIQNIDDLDEKARRASGIPPVL